MAIILLWLTHVMNIVLYLCCLSIVSMFRVYITLELVSHIRWFVDPMAID